jgi:hypothetical protein
MVIINNVSDSEWRLILSALNSYKNDRVFNMLYGSRPKEELDNLIKKVRKFTGANDSMRDFKMEYESIWTSDSDLKE